MLIQETSMVHATFIMHTKAYFIVYTNIHYAHQSIFHSTYKHSFSYHNVLHCTRETFTLHTIAYCIAYTKHSYCTPVYRTQLSLEVCHSCVRFLLSVLLVSMMRIPRGMWVPQTSSVTAANRICRNEFCTARHTLGVLVGAQRRDAEYTAQNMAATMWAQG